MCWPSWRSVFSKLRMALRYVICVDTRVFHEGCQLRGAGKDPVLIILGHLRFCGCPFEIGMCRNVWRTGVEAERTIASSSTGKLQHFVCKCRPLCIPSAPLHLILCLNCWWLSYTLNFYIPLHLYWSPNTLCPVLLYDLASSVNICPWGNSLEPAFRTGV